MNRLFIHVYLDEDVDVLVAQLLRGRGYDATTTVDVGRVGEADEQQLLYATGRDTLIDVTGGGRKPYPPRYPPGSNPPKKLFSPAAAPDQVL